MVFRSIFALLLAVGGSAAEGHSPSITVNRDFTREADLEIPWSSPFPLSIESEDFSFFITSSLLRLRVRQGIAILTYEGPLAETPLAPLLNSLAASEFVGAYVIADERAPGGSHVTIRNRSGSFTLENCFEGLPEPFRFLEPLMAASRKTVQERPGLKLLQTKGVDRPAEPEKSEEKEERKIHDSPLNENRPARSRNIFAAPLLPLRIERRALYSELGLPPDVLEIDESGIRLMSPERNSILTYVGSLKESGFQSVLKELEPSDLAGAHSLSRWNDDLRYEIVLSSRCGYRVIQRMQTTDLPDEYASLKQLLLAFERALSHRPGLRLERREPIHFLRSTNTKPLDCVITGPATCELGKLPAIKVEILNQTGKEIQLVGNLDGSDDGMRYPRCEFHVIRPDGTPPPQYGRCGNTNEIHRGDFVAVPAGGKFDPYQKIDDRGFFSSSQITAECFSIPGEYRIRFLYSTDSEDPNAWNGNFGSRDEPFSEKFLKLLGEVPKTTVLSNEITVTVAEVGK